MANPFRDMSVIMQALVAAAIAFIIVLVGVYLPFSPLAPALGFKSLPPLYWPLLAGLLTAYLLLTHVMKNWFHRRFGLD